jgi:hypothetical protein
MRAADLLAGSAEAVGKLSRWNEEGVLGKQGWRAAEATQVFGFRYDGRTILVAGDFVTPLALPAGRIAVADLLP